MGGSRRGRSPVWARGHGLRLRAAMGDKLRAVPGGGVRRGHERKLARRAAAERATCFPPPGVRFDIEKIRSGHPARPARQRPAGAERPVPASRSIRQAGWYDFYLRTHAVLDSYGAGIPRRISPVAADPGVHRRGPWGRGGGAIRSDVCFAGTGGLREELIGHCSPGAACACGGPGRETRGGSPIRDVADRRVLAGKMVRAFAGAKVVLNLHSWSASGRTG